MLSRHGAPFDTYGVVKYARKECGFRRNAVNERPVNAFILSLLGSCFVLLGTILGYVLSSGIYFYSDLSATFAAVAAFFGTVMLLASVMLYVRPEFHVAWGVTILVVSVGSLTSTFSGFAGFGLGIVGMILRIVGGALAIGWSPGGPQAPTTAVPFRVCLTCGRPSYTQFAYCPYCGAPAPLLNPPPGMPSQRPPSGPPS